MILDGLTETHDVRWKQQESMYDTSSENAAISK